MNHMPVQRVFFQFWLCQCTLPNLPIHNTYTTVQDKMNDQFSVLGGFQDQAVVIVGFNKFVAILTNMLCTLLNRLLRVSQCIHACKLLSFVLHNISFCSNYIII